MGFNEISGWNGIEFLVQLKTFTIDCNQKLLGFVFGGSFGAVLESNETFECLVGEINWSTTESRIDFNHTSLDSIIIRLELFFIRLLLCWSSCCVGLLLCWGSCVGLLLLCWNSFYSFYSFYYYSYYYCVEALIEQWLRWQFVYNSFHTLFNTNYLRNNGFGVNLNKIKVTIRRY